MMNCPHLGLRQNPESRFSIPTSANFCHKVTPVESVRRAYQEKVCLSVEHKSCPIFQQDWQRKLPPGVRSRPSKKSKKINYFWLSFGLAIILLAVLVGYILLKEPERFAFWVDRNMTTETVPIDVAEIPIQMTDIYTETSSPISSATNTNVPASLVATTIPTEGMISKSLTPTLIPPTPGPGLFTPFGPQGEYLLHQVKFGDNLPNLAKQYQTDRDVIVASNSMLTNQALQPDQVIVIMPGRMDSFGVDDLLVLFLEQDTPIEDLASSFGVTPEELRYYSDLGPGGIVPGGRWLIFPRREVTPTTTPTAIPTPDLSEALTEPFGSNNAYILHQVQSGDSLPILEDLYLTSSEVITAANEIEGSIQLGQVLVILLERRDASRITQFAVQFVAEDTLVEDLAAELGVLAADLVFHNDLNLGDTIPAAQWVIYPAPLEEE